MSKNYNKSSLPIYLSKKHWAFIKNMSGALGHGFDTIGRESKTVNSLIDVVRSILDENEEFRKKFIRFLNSN